MDAGAPSRRTQLDDVTGLPNGAALSEDFQRGGFDATHVAYIDLNAFGSFNRELGHDAGDAALAVIGGSCRAVPDEEGVVYRLGGDEFALVASGTRARVAETLNHLLGQIKLPIASVDDRCVTATAGLVQILVGEEWRRAYGRAHVQFIARRGLGSDRFNAP
jgi:diguanylate cyclase (GGDEF)-like protein